MWTYAIAVVPKMHQRQRIKRLAAQVESNIPQGETVYALDPNYQPIFFYMRSKLVYASDIDEVPMDATYLLVRPEREQETSGKQSLGAAASAPDHAHRPITGRNRSYCSRSSEAVALTVLGSGIS